VTFANNYLCRIIEREQATTLDAREEKESESYNHICSTVRPTCGISGRL